MRNTDMLEIDGESIRTPRDGGLAAGLKMFEAFVGKGDSARPMLQQLCTLSYAMRQVAVREVFGKHGLDMRDWQVLSALNEIGPASQREASMKTKLDKVAVNRSASRLKERGLLSSRPNQRDGRSHLLDLTQAGRDTISICNAELKMLERATLDRFTNYECDELSRLLAKLGTALDELGGHPFQLS